MKFFVVQLFCILSIFNLCSCGYYNLSALEVEWTDQGTATDFKIIKRGLTSAPTGYYAIGFSEDQKMKNDDVAMCKVNAGSGTVEHYRNVADADNSIPLIDSDRTIGFSNIQVTYVNGVLTCAFTRQKTMSNIANYFDLSTNSYFLLSAVGSGTGDQLQVHTQQTWSSVKVDFTSTVPTGTVDLTLFEVEYINQGTATDFKIIKRGLTSAPTGYYAFALSADDDMGQDDVAVCKVTAGSGTVEHYKNPDGQKPPVYIDSDRAIGFSNIQVTYTNGVLTCSFRRQNANANIENYLDVSADSYFLLSATGSFSGDSLDYHSTNRKHSSSKIDLTATTTIAPTTTQSLTTTLSPSGAGSVSSEYFNVEYTPSATYTEFKFTKSGLSSAPTGYYAFALSADDDMGQDDVAVCKVTAGSGTVEHYKNPDGHKQPVYIDSDRAIGFSNIQVTYTNGVLTCSFRRQNANGNIANYFDIASRSYYGLFAVGSFSGDSLSYHSGRTASSLIDFTTGGSVSAQTQDKSKTKTHGSMMAIAWMLFAAVGIHVARYNKSLLPSRKLCGVQIWFVIHRPIMMAAAIFSVIAFLVILAEADWAWIETSESAAFTHSIFGIICICLAIIQGLVAFCRPAPTHKRRFIFNWFHRITGLTTYLCAVVAIYIGVTLADINIGNKGWGIVLGWNLWILLKDILSEGVNFFCVRKNRSESYAVNSNGLALEDANKTNKGFEMFKSILFVLHVLVCLSFTTALVVVIAIGEP